MSVPAYQEGKIALRSHSEPPTLQPVIAELLRTRFCVPGSVFIVEGVDASIATSNRHRTIRLLLADGELCIQSLLKGNLHNLVDDGRIHNGCYVALRDFNVTYVPHSSSSHDAEGIQQESDQSKFRDMHVARELVFLVIGALEVVVINPGIEKSTGVQETLSRQLQGADSIAFAMPPRQTRAVHTSKGHTNPAVVSSVLKTVADHGDEDSSADESFGVMAISQPKATQRRAQQQAQHSERPVSRQSSHQQRWSSYDVAHPLSLTPLRSIPNLPFKQNWKVNVLAVVSAVSDVEPSQLPPHTQRTCRLADPTTGKHVLLTVFLEPEEFAPKVGSVVLLIGVKNHRFDGGSLKKYTSDKPEGGRRWWYEDPRHIEWCDVAGMKSWWDKKVEGEA